MNRISCYECFFSKPDRYSDITIGDFWGIRKFYPELSVEHGVSIVQVNTVKGEKLEKYIRSNSICYDINICDYKAKMRNGLAKPGGIIINKNRLNFLRMEREHGFDYAIRGVFPLYKDFFAFIKAYAKTKIKGFIG